MFRNSCCNNNIAGQSNQISLYLFYRTHTEEAQWNLQTFWSLQNFAALNMSCHFCVKIPMECSNSVLTAGYSNDSRCGSVRGNLSENSHWFCPSVAGMTYFTFIEAFTLFHLI